MKSLLLGCLVLAGCGRLGFGSDDTSDSQSAAFSCSAATAPDPLTITGRTFRYMSFDNTQVTPLTAMIDVVNTDTGITRGTATSDSAGAYSLSYATGGSAEPTYIRYSRATTLATHVFFDRPLDHDLSGGGALWTPGDGPLWDDTQMNMIYQVAGAQRGTGAGAINVGVRDCANNPIGGVTVTFDPPVADVRYQDDTGMPSMQLMATGTMFAHAIALNPPTSVTMHITASAPGLRFTDATFTVTPSTNNLVLIHGGP